ncbi:MAG: DUF1501 domain-containing protein [Burkholderiales bacterium]
MKRRHFLALSGLAAGQYFLPGKVWATPSSRQSQAPRLLVVLLRGAYDGASLLVPHGYPFYYASRPSIALARPNPDDPKAVLDIGQGYGLHPAVSSSLYALFQQQQALLVPFSGSADVSRSHFQAQDVMELGQNPQGRLDYASGFLNRLAEILNRGNPRLGGISFTPSLTLAFKGKVNVPNISLKGQVRDIPNDRSTRLLAALYQGSRLGDYVNEGIQTRHQVSAELEKEMRDASRGAAKATGFNKEVRSMAALMRDNPAYTLGFAEVGGWDTHVNQGAASGPLATNLENLAQGLSSFADELGPAAWRQTVVAVMSEFGRTFRENGNRGTDHGHGNTLWVLGGGISGGKLAGELIDVSEKTLFQNRDFPVLNDYRAVLSHLAQRMYGLSPAQLDRLFPGIRPSNLGII